MRARAKSATREEKRFARVTFLVGDDFTRSTMYFSFPRRRPFARHAFLAFVEKKRVTKPMNEESPRWKLQPL